MPYTIPYSFSQFLEGISLTGKHDQTATARSSRIRELLATNYFLVDSFPTGSLVRDTALRGRSDLDVFAVLNYGVHIKGKTPRQVLEELRENLGDAAKLVKKNGQAVTLYFTTWPSVDVVPACRVVDNEELQYYEIPDMNRGEWIKARPRLHDNAVSALPDAQRSMIRMAKTWNLAHSAYMQSYHIEVLALGAPAASTDDWPWSVLRFFDYASKNFRYLWHQDAMVDDYLDYTGREEVGKRLDRAVDLSRSAWYQTHSVKDDEESIRLYRILFGDEFPAYG